MSGYFPSSCPVFETRHFGDWIDKDRIQPPKRRVLNKNRAEDNVQNCDSSFQRVAGSNSRRKFDFIKNVGSYSVVKITTGLTSLQIQHFSPLYAQL
jgi:hypothetical protein